MQLLTDWEIVRQNVMLEHKQLMHLYQKSKTGLQVKLEAGIALKRSTSKGDIEVDFVPTNLHVQQMKVSSADTNSKGESSGCGGCKLSGLNVMFQTKTV